MLHPLVIPSKDVQVYFNTGNLPSVKILTATSINISDSKTLQPIYAIGTAEPLTIEDVNAQYTFSITFQTGDYEEILNAVNGALPAGETPYATISQLESFQFSIVEYARNAIVPVTVTTTLTNLKTDSRSSDYNRNDPETLTTITAQGTGINRIVTPLA